ncbi:MAG: hypothetical protein M3541_03560 [Acidobacteriota bacterium]|nr:hypothetical protein [Acidobacteriota bacterium]MDQ3417848.1 hypothetical protein [Acidobacteriota bacterium]
MAGVEQYAATFGATTPASPEILPLDVSNGAATSAHACPSALERGILTIGFTTGIHDRYHLPADEAHALDPKKMEAIGR